METIPVPVPLLLGMVVVCRARAAVSEPRHSFGPCNAGAEPLRPVFSRERVRESWDAGYDVEMSVPDESAGSGTVVGNTARPEIKKAISQVPGC
jgi:hypothetical protein